MKAAVDDDRRDVRVEDVEEPSGPGDGEVLVAPLWCGNCGTDVHEYTDGPIVTPVDPHPLTGATNPQVLGHEFSAEVLEVGGGVTNVRSGDRVSVMPLIYCGHCYYCRLGQHHLCVTMACTGLSHRWGGLAAAAIVSAGQYPHPRRARRPAGRPRRTDRRVRIRRRSRRGQPGQLRARHRRRADRHAQRRVRHRPWGDDGHRVRTQPRAPVDRRGARRPGALDPTAVDIVEAVRELTGGLGVDAAIECSGSAAALDACIRATRSRGTVAQTGLHVRPAPIDAFQLSLHEITLVGTWCYPVTDWPRIIALLASGRMDGRAAVTSSLGLDGTVDGFERLIDPQGSDVKILINPEGVGVKNMSVEGKESSSPAPPKALDGASSNASLPRAPTCVSPTSTEPGPRKQQRRSGSRAAPPWRQPETSPSAPTSGG